MTKPRIATLKPAVRNAYDHYGELLAHLVRLTREIASAPLDELTAANLHMEQAGTRYDPTDRKHRALNDHDRAALASHREFFELLAKFGTDYQQLRDAANTDDGHER